MIPEDKEEDQPNNSMGSMTREMISKIEEEKIADHQSLRSSFCEAAYDFLDAAIENIRKKLLPQYKELAFFECFTMKEW